MASITAFNSTFVLVVPGLIFPTPLQGYSVDDMFGIDPLQRKEVAMGVDGFLTAGRINVPVKMGVTLMADSLSNGVFETWDAAEVQLQDVYWANGTILMPSVQKKFSLTRGTLEIYQPIAHVGKTLKERKYAITWQSITPSLI